jgi:hypothetical protein
MLRVISLGKRCMLHQISNCGTKQGTYGLGSFRLIRAVKTAITRHSKFKCLLASLFTTGDCEVWSSSYLTEWTLPCFARFLDWTIGCAHSWNMLPKRTSRALRQNCAHDAYYLLSHKCSYCARIESATSCIVGEIPTTPNRSWINSHDS